MKRVNQTFGRVRLPRRGASGQATQRGARRVLVAPVRVKCEGIYLFEGPARVVENRVTNVWDVFLVILSGAYAATWRRGTRSGRVEARAGDVVYWPLDTWRVEQSGGGTTKQSMRALTLTCEWQDRPGEADDLPPVVRDRQGLITATARAILMTQKTLLTRQGAILSSFASSIAAEYLRLADADGGELVSQVVRYTQERLRRRVTLAELSRLVGLEKHYFCSRYKATTGRTPMQDVRRIRIERALDILHSHPAMPLKDVAYRVGMGNCYLLSRWLKRTVGLTSREIRAGRT